MANTIVFLCILTIFHCILTKIHKYTIFLCICKGLWNTVCILVYSSVFLSIFYLPSVFYCISTVFSAPPKTVCVFLLYFSVFSKLYSLSVFEYILRCIKKYIESGWGESYNTVRPAFDTRLSLLQPCEPLSYFFLVMALLPGPSMVRAGRTPLR